MLRTTLTRWGKKLMQEQFPSLQEGKMAEGWGGGRIKEGVVRETR